ncbi:hypothetical protein OsJ_14053 [Oryza sativa Japonica Group]|uniref:Uncharacterized protein n=1 Tax=Oryza sativa subsp. japonica TaxID=39947 RepID=B9FE43_ORYSJ|nr:hypothetical protein OsJ_14053 [Oryza sativa Japonica Group]
MEYSKNKFHIETASYSDLHRMRHYIISNCDEAMPWLKSNIEGISGDSTVIEEARAASMPEPDDDDIPDEDDESDDTYIVDGVVAPVESHGGDDDDDFFV